MNLVRRNMTLLLAFLCLGSASLVLVQASAVGAEYLTIALLVTFVFSGIAKILGTRSVENSTPDKLVEDSAVRDRIIEAMQKRLNSEVNGDPAIARKIHLETITELYDVKRVMAVASRIEARNGHDGTTANKSAAAAQMPMSIENLLKFLEEELAIISSKRAELLFRGR